MSTSLQTPFQLVFVSGKTPLQSWAEVLTTDTNKLKLVSILHSEKLHSNSLQLNFSEQVLSTEVLIEMVCAAWLSLFTDSQSTDIVKM